MCPWSPSSSSRVGQGGKATRATAPDADILREIVCLLTQRVRAGRATFLIKVKSHRGEPIIERADTLRRMDGKCPMTTQGGKTGRIGLRSRCRKGTRQHVQCGRTVCATPSGNKRGGLGQEQLSELSDTQSVDRSQTTSFLFQFTEDTPNRDRFKKHLVPEVFSRFRN